jgi:NADPH2:quinone reductase
VLCRALGEPDALPDVLEIAELPRPVPGPGEVVVDVSHIGLNFHETLLVAGRHVVQPELPFSPGSEYAGTVSDVGPGVDGVRIGDRVAGNEDYGVAREQIAVQANRVTVLPPAVPDRTAAAVLVGAATALHALRQRAAIAPGETLAVLGASGGVGLAAVDVGRLLGAHVIACASSAERTAFLRPRAHAVVDYSTQDLKAELRRLSNGRGVDVVLDPVGGPHAEAAFRALAWRGRHLVVGFASGTIPQLPLNLPLVKGAAALGVFFGEFTRREPQAHHANVADVLDWTGTGKLVPHIHEVLPFERCAEGLQILARRQARGKVLLALSPSPRSSSP